ncbi:hypothetical protein OFN33_32645, partial [Escherichia coli]|nr:hypothetical protein [Escherichia coli]
WAGNVRQLRNCLERAALLADNGRITIKELAPEVIYRREGASVAVNYSPQNTAAVSSFQNAAPTSLRDVERQQILNAL